MADPPPRHLPPKKEVALALLEGDSLFVHLDPRKEGVLVPRSLGKQPQLVLQIGLHLAIRIPDLEIDEDGVSCTLSFNRSPFWCRMPWSAIYALVGPDGRGMLWPEDVPPEVAAQMRAGRGAKAPPRKPRPKLAAVSDDEEARDVTTDAAPPPRATKRATARPALAPVPPPADARRDRPARAPLGAHHPPSAPGASSPGSRGGGAPSRGAPSRGPAPQDPTKKPKRELPPYLRVVK